MLAGDNYSYLSERKKSYLPFPLSLKAALSNIAIVVALLVPIFTSGRATEWFTAILNSTVDSKANAQTIAQAIGIGQVTVTADAQEYDEITQNVRAIGNASFTYPEAQIQAKADEI
jgi:hypothetical protein